MNATPRTKKVAVFVNQKAHAGDHSMEVGEIRRGLWGWDVEIFQPESVTDFQNACLQLSKEQYEAVVLVGGDGTANVVLPALTQRQIPLAIFPKGTANDLATHLGMQPDWSAIKKLIDTRSFKAIDVISANGRLFATVGGVGIGALIVGWINHKRQSSPTFRKMIKLTGADIYNLVAARTIFLKRGYLHKLKISYRDHEQVVNVSSLLVCNQNIFANDIMVYKEARNDDGRFNVAMIQSKYRMNLLPKLIYANLGQDLPAHAFFAADHLKIEDVEGRDIVVFGDGEVLASHPSIEFRVIPRRFLVYCHDTETEGRAA